MFFSIIIPVFNRPDEISELLESLTQQDFKKPYEVVIVDDGSTVDCHKAIEKYDQKLDISYFYIENSGPGAARNVAMQKAKGNYFIIFDSDCIIPKHYLTTVYEELSANFVDFYGGPDAAQASFSKIQKAINFAMTSIITTGGIRGGTEKMTTFEPRSFNMGISQKAFLASNGFANIHPGEDPDLTMRLWNLGFQSKLLPAAYVYHKRRITWEGFSNQVKKFGKVRPILQKKHPKYNKISYYFPALFVVGFFLSIVMATLLYDIFLKIYFTYFAIIFLVSSFQNKSLIIGWYSVVAVWKQFFGYGFGFIKSFYKINILKQSPEMAFPELFYKKK